MKSLTDDFVAIVGEENLFHGEDAVAPYATDVYRAKEMPRAVLRPPTVDKLQQVVALCARESISFTIRGGGASYTDGYNTIDPLDVVIDTSRLNQIVDINVKGGYVVVEAGVTWAALADALEQHGLRTPFRGPFSGLKATVGASMSQNSISHGSGGYGISAESALSFDIIQADGTMLRTGSGAFGETGFARFCGPDLTGLFTGDGGALGVKARIVLPLIAARKAHKVVSFSFPDFASMHESMRRIAIERIEESHFALDAALSQGQIARQDRAGGALKMALSVLRSSPSLLAGAKQVAAAGLLARGQIKNSAFMTHYIVEGFDDGECKSKLHRLRELVQGLGREITATVPAVVRSMPFAPFYNVLGPQGERWVPLHGILPHHQASPFHEALESFYAERETEMKRLGVWSGGMFSTVGSSGFLYEIALYWPDEQTAYHTANVPEEYLGQLPKFAKNLEAREYVEQLKSGLITLYDDFGAIHFQLGRAYPYADRLEQPARDLVGSIKTALDPDMRVGPGLLGLTKA
ncbi:FAD-binding oxidoreductase [Parasphingorhabdus sp.]|uniref:FAD-binding oxidoreductase n=1 Tax=Parasphingorhabdus sp. TaxID=2709688 RepID=UPI002F91D2A4